MSYQLYDVNGYLGDLSTTRGLQELRNYVMGEGSEAVEGLVTLGASLITDDLLTGLKALKPEKASIKKTVSNLVSLASKAELVIIINNGLDDGL